MYLLSILVGIGLIIYGGRSNKKAIKYLGALILLIDIIVPVASFIAGYIDGTKSN